jgi:hypothetical protein
MLVCAAWPCQMTSFVVCHVLCRDDVRSGVVFTEFGFSLSSEAKVSLTRPIAGERERYEIVLDPNGTTWDVLQVLVARGTTRGVVWQCIGWWSCGPLVGSSRDVWLCFAVAPLSHRPATGTSKAPRTAAPEWERLSWSCVLPWCVTAGLLRSSFQ